MITVIVSSVLIPATVRGYKSSTHLDYREWRRINLLEVRRQRLLVDGRLGMGVAVGVPPLEFGGAEVVVGATGAVSPPLLLNVGGAGPGIWKVPKSP